MNPSLQLASLSPAIVVHLFMALGALALGPFALWARKGSRLHRAMGYACVTLMLGAAVSSLFIRDFRLPNVFGYTPIHLVAALTFAGIGRAMWFIAHHNIANHRRAMQITYFAACVGAGSFALLPQRYLGNLLWHQTLGWV